MSPRRRPAAEQPDAFSALDALTGRKLPGGCPDCSSYQLVARAAESVYELLVHHDPACPAMKGTTS